MEDRCVVCGEIIPEGSHICKSCENKYLRDDDERSDAKPVKLRKCPFCAFKYPHMMIHPPDNVNLFAFRYSILCDFQDGGCGAEGGWSKTKEGAIDLWNQRKRKYE